MSSVDNRVVHMIFDNKKFEEGIQTSIKSLEALKKGLNLDDAAKKLSGLDKAGKEFSLENMADSIDVVKDRFSTLGIVGMTIIQDLTRTIMNLGKKAFDNTIGLIKEGGKRRALNIEQAKFQFQGLGMDVEQAMDDALYAVSGTAYGLDEAAKAASQLGASGIELGNDMKNVLRGISGVAAMTNSSYDDISRIFIKVAGNGRLMGQELLQLSGRGINAAAVLAKEFNTSEENIRKMVSAGQISFEMFSTAMNNAFGEHATKANETYTGSLSNVKAALSRLGASIYTDHLEHMRDIFNALIPVIDDLHDVLKPTIEQFMKFSKGVTENVVKSLSKMDFSPLVPAIEGVKNIIKGLYGVLKPIKEAFRDIFPPMTAENLLVISERFKSFTENLKLSDTASENLNRTFKGLFAIIDIGKEAFFAFTNALKSVVSYLLPVGDGVLSMTGSFGDFLVSIRNVIKDTDVFNKIFETLGSVIKPVADVVKNAIESIFDSLASFKTVDTTGVEDVGKRFERGFKPFTAIANLVKGAFDIIVKVVEKVAPLFTGLASAIGKGLGSAQKAIMDWLNDVNFSAGLDLFNAGVFATVLLGIRKFTKSLTDITDNAGGIISGIKEIFGGITGTFEALQSRLKADTLIKIATAIGVLTASVVVLSMIDSDKVATSLTAIAVLFTELFASMAIFEKVMSGSGFRGMTKIATTMILMSTAVLILATAMKKISDLDWSGISKGLIGVGALMGELILAVKLMPNEGRMMKGAGSLILFATAINILANSVKKLGGLDVATLTKGLIGIGVLLSELALFMKMTDLDGMGLLKGLGIMTLATALVILSSAVKKLGEIDTATIIQGLIGVGVVLAELGIFMTMTGDVTKVMSTAVGLTILGAAMLIFAKAIENMGQMTWGEIAKGLITMGGALTIITVALQFVQGSLGGAAALLVIAGALAILTPVLKVLGGMTWQEIATGLITLAGTFAVIGGAALLLAPVTPAILALAGSITLLGAAVALIGGGVLALSAGLAALGVAGTAGVSALVLAVTGLIGLIPMFIQQIANGLIAFANVIGEGAPAIIKAVAAVLIAISEAIIQAVPTMVEAIVTFLEAMLNAIVDFVPKLVDGGMKLILGILKGISDNIKKVVETAIEIVINFIDGVASMIPKVIQAGVDLIISFIDGLAEAIRGNTDRMIEAMNNLMTAIIEAGIKMLKGSLNLFKDVGSLIMDSGFVQGIRDKFGKITDTIKEIPGKIISTLSGYMDDFLSIGGDIIGGIIKGITGGISKITEAAKDVAKNALEGAKNFLKIRSPSKVFQKDVGENIGAGMIKGMKNITPKVTKASSKMSESVYEMSKKWIDKQRKYHDLSLEAELSKWKETLKYYKEGQDEYYEILNHIADTENRIRQKSFEHSKNWIDKEKQYKRLSLFDELEAWERVQARYEKGTTQRAEADKEVFRVRSELIEAQKKIDQEYYEASKAINDKLIEDIQAVNDEYERAVENRTRALANTWGLFEKIEKPEEPIDGKELISNLQSQVEAFDRWQRRITKLAKKGLDEGLMQELIDLGPKSLDQIEALSNLTSKELTKYSELWRTKHEQAKTQALKELEGLKNETSDKIKALEAQAKEDLDALQKTWQEKTSALVNVVVDEYQVMGDDIIEGLRALKKKSVEEIGKQNEEIKSTINKENWLSLGLNITNGITQGIQKGEEPMLTAVRTLARKTKAVMEKELEIKSPSRVFMQIGEYVTDGFKKGIIQNGSNVITSIKDIGNDAISTMSKVIKNIVDILNSDMDLSPTIRPVLDMSNVRDSLKDVYDSIFINTSINNVRRAASYMPGKQNYTSDNKTNDKITEIKNEFIVYATIREEADIEKVSQRLYRLQNKNSRGRGVPVYDRV